MHAMLFALLVPFGLQQAGAGAPQQGAGRALPAAPAAAVPKQQLPALDEDAARTLLDALQPAEWDYEAFGERLARALEGPLGASPFAEILLGRYVALARAEVVPPTAWRRLEALVQSGRLPGAAELAARLALHERRLRTGGEPGADPLRAYTSTGLAVGPFGDAGSLWIGVPFAPELEEPDVKARYPGRYGRVGWRLVRRAPDHSRIDLKPEFPEERRKGCQYGLFQYESGEAREAWLEVHCRGSFEAFWNGRRIARVNRSTGFEPARLYFAVQLARGWNRLLFKTCHVETSTVALRLVDARGRTLQGVTEEEGMVVHPLPAAAAGPGRPFRDFVQEARALAGRGPLFRALAGRILQKSGLEPEGFALVEGAFAEAKSDPAVRAAYVAALGNARHLPRDVARTRLRRALELPAAQLRAHRTLFLAKLKRLTDDDRGEEALRLIAAAKAEHPRHPDLLKNEQEIYDQLSWDGEKRRVFEERFRLRPHDPVLLEAYTDRMARADRAAEALALIERELKTRPGEPRLLKQALYLARLAGDRAKILAYLKRVHARNPHARRAVLEIADAQADAGDLDEAMRLLESLPSAERDPDVQKRLGDLALRAGDEERATAHYRRALALDPSRHAIRRLLQRLRGLDPFPETAPFQLDAGAEAAAFKKRPDEAGAPSTLVLDQMIVRLYADGSRMEEVHQLRRINDLNGVEAHEEAGEAASADELLEVRTILPDGRSFYPHRVSGSFSLPKLKPGAFVEEHYRNYFDAPGVGPLDYPSFFFQSTDEPFRFSRLIVIMPKGFALGRFRLHNLPEDAHTVREMGDLVAHVFLRRDMPRLEQEPRMPPIRELVPWVEYVRAPDLRAYVRERRTSFLKTTRVLPEIAAKAAELTKGLRGERAKARAIHEFVHAHTPDRPGSSEPISVLLKGEGPRFFLELALLRAAGIAWTPAMVRPVPPEIDTEPEPGERPGNFWSVGAALVRPKDGPPYWLFAGAPRWQPFGEPPVLLRGAPLDRCPALLLVGDAGIPLRLSGRNAGEHLRSDVRATLTLDGRDASARATVLLPGDEGLRYAEMLRNNNRNVRRIVAQQIAAQAFPGFSLVEFELPDLERKSEPLKFVMKLRRPNFASKRGASFRLPPPLPPIRLLRGFGGRSRRVHPFVWGNLVGQAITVRIEARGFRFTKVPDGLLARSQILDYGLSFERAQDGVLVVRRRFHLLPGRIPPERYGEFLELCRRIDERELLPLELAPAR